MSHFPLKINCTHFPHCSGCQLNANVNHPPIFEEARNFFLQKGIKNFQLHSGSMTRWRTRAKLVIRGDSKNPKIGLFKKGTHEVVEIPHCQIHHPKINEAVLYLKKFIQDVDLAPYNEISGNGLLRYAQFVVQRQTGKVQLSLVLNTHSLSEDLRKKLELFWIEKKDFFHSIWVNFNTRRDNVIFGENWLLLHGEQFLWEQICQREICFHPSSFAQANLDLFEKMIEKIKATIFLRAKVTEYYGGVGAIGLCLAEKCEKINCCEITPSAKICFEESRKKLPQELQERMKFFSGNVTDHLTLLENEVIIADPPRKGLDPSFINQLQDLKKDTLLIYISCGWDSFKRDCEILLNKWGLEEAESYLFFPGTNSIETIAIFKKI